MVVKYKKKRLLFTQILSVLVSLFFLLSLTGILFSDMNYLIFISFVFQIILWLGLLYFQNARYDDEKIMAQFGWPRVYYKDITSVKYVFGDILIKTEKRELGINTAYADKKSLDDFIEFLEQKIDFQLNLG